MISVVPHTDEGTVSALKELRLSADDFEVKSIIGRGHFGEVSRVTNLCIVCIHKSRPEVADAVLRCLSYHLNRVSRASPSACKTERGCVYKHGYDMTN